MEAEQWRRSIESNISEFGFHVTGVLPGTTPRFAYSVGLLRSGHPELVAAGGCDVFMDGLVETLAAAAGSMLSVGRVEIDGYSARKVHPSWARRLMRGVFDVLDVREFDALQVVGERVCVDEPDMSAPFDAGREPVWQWLDEDANEWPWPGHEGDWAAVTERILRGDPPGLVVANEDWLSVSSVADRVDAEWEYELVPLSTVLAVHPSLARFVGTPVDDAYRLNDDGEWEYDPPEG